MPRFSVCGKMWEARINAVIPLPKICFPDKIGIGQRGGTRVDEIRKKYLEKIKQLRLMDDTFFKESLIK